MSVDYELVCHKHRERVSLCTDGMSGPMLHCDKSLAAFSITHRGCCLSVIDEHDNSLDEYLEWDAGDCMERLDYDFN